MKVIVPLKKLQKICSKLISIHGQGNTEELFSSKTQLQFFDYFFKDELLEIIENVKTLRSRYIKLEKEIFDIEAQKRERAKEIDFLKFQIGEIEEAQLKENEEETLKEERELLTNAQRIIEALNSISVILSGRDSENGGLIHEIETALNIMKDIRTYSSNLENIGRAFSESHSILKDVSKEIGTEVQKLINRYDEKRLDEIVERINTLNNLKRKYGETIEKVWEIKGRQKKIK